MSIERLTQRWKSIDGVRQLDTPSLLIDLDAVERNISEMIACVGGQPSRLRPHLKTHKSSEIIRKCVDQGITKFKAATIAEAAAAAEGGATDVLLAHQLMGVKLDKLRALVDRFPDTTFNALVDCGVCLAELNEKMSGVNRDVGVFIDIDCGMHRTGIPFGDDAASLMQTANSLAHVSYRGLHVYDGHVHDAELETRREKAAKTIDAIKAFADSKDVNTIICGGSPTFAIYAKETEYECSPGTTILWDFGYGRPHPDLNYEVAAALATRVISHPGERQWCLDLGYKAVASEMPLDIRVVFPDVPDATLVGHSEEHLVIETDAQLSIGQVLIAMPKHICPTVALHAKATVVKDGSVTDKTIAIDARDR